MPIELVLCNNCDQDTSRRYYICGQGDLELCQDCFDHTACAAGVHGPHCALLIIQSDVGYPAFAEVGL